MYGWNHKSVTQTNSRQNTQNPSFSSSLLDEIYCSMDAGVEKSGEFKLREDNVIKKKGNVGGGRRSSAVEDEGIASLRPAFLVQKWLEMKANAKNLTQRKRSSSLPDSDRKSVIDNDPFFFGSVLSSSDSSSDSLGFYESKPQKPSCFGPFRPKQVKANKQHDQHIEFGYCPENNQTRVDHGGLIKSKTRALKIYANLKKIRQPISPGGRLTTFLNNLFTNGHHLKKPRDLNDKKIETTSKSTHGSTCSSASSFTRSCLSKNSPRTREKLNNGIRRTVRFYPISVIIDEDCRPCGEKIICDEKDFMKVHVTSSSMSQNFDHQDEEDDYNDDDMTSDTSSDLFELDHLSILKECEELPVYGTTHFRTNCAIANGLIC